MCGAHTRKGQVRAVEATQAQRVIEVIIAAHETLGAVRISEDPRAEPLFDLLLLVAGGEGLLLIEHTFFPAIPLDDVIDGRAFQVQGLLQQPDAVGTVRAVVRGGGHRPHRLQARLDAPHRIGRQVGDGHRVRWHPKEVGGEGLDIRLRDPGGAQVGVDIAGEHVLGLHQAQGLSIAGIGGAGALGGRELGAHVAREIDIGGVPDLGVGVLIDEVAQLGDDLPDGRRIERRDIRQINDAPLVQGDQQPFLGALHGRSWRVAPDHVVVHDGRFLGQARALVIVLQGHDQHGVRIVAERHEVRHAPDGGAIRGGRQRRLVDRAVGRHEAVVDAGERPAGLLALPFGPALVLGAQDTAGVVAEGDERGQAAAQQRAIGLQGRRAMRHWHGLSLLDLHEGLASP